MTRSPSEGRGHGSPGASRLWSRTKGHPTLRYWIWPRGEACCDGSRAAESSEFSCMQVCCRRARRRRAASAAGEEQGGSRCACAVLLSRQRRHVHTTIAAGWRQEQPPRGRVPRGRRSRSHGAIILGRGRIGCLLDQRAGWKKPANRSSAQPFSIPSTATCRATVRMPCRSTGSVKLARARLSWSPGNSRLPCT
jgi:hypothetical protein